MKQITLANGLVLELRQRRGEFLGIGRVQAGRVRLRHGRRPMFVEIRTPYGVQACDFTLTDCTESADGARLTFAMNRRDGGPMEWQLHECRRCYNPADWTDPVRPADDTRLELLLRPVERSLGGHRFTGFSYQYLYRSSSLPIYMILDRGTWELGGEAVGNEFWMRNCFAAPFYRAQSADEYYSTEWYLPGITNPNIFQFAPLQTELQGFSFTASKHGVLVTWATEVAHVRSLFEKQRGANDFVHMHEHCGDLALEFQTSPMEVLFSAGKRDRVGLANVYEAVRETVHETLHAQIGMRRERVTTYGQIEEWGDADLDLYRTDGLPALADAGVRTLMMVSHFRNNMNTFGTSNICCTVDYHVPENVGEDRLTALCQAARARGVTIEMWGNTSISVLSYLTQQKRRNGQAKRIDYLPAEGSIWEALEKAEMPFVRTTFGSIEADHYTPEFAVLNLRDATVRDYWMKCWRHAHDHIGLGGIFLDSSFNLSSDKFHYEFLARQSGVGATADQTHLLGHVRPPQPPPGKVLSQYRAHLDLMIEMQRCGYVYCNEDLGVFGIHRHGPGIEKRLETLSIWGECVANFDAKALGAAGADPEDVFFKGLAYRMMWSLIWHVPTRKLTFNYNGPRDDSDLPTARHLELLKAFSAVTDFMHNREILPREKGVVYRHEGRTVLWAFEDCKLPLDGPASIRDVVEGSAQIGTAIRARSGHVYLVTPQ